jgi:hypothetical protein
MTITKDSFKLNEFDYACCRNPCLVCKHNSCAMLRCNARAQWAKGYTSEILPNVHFDVRISLVTAVLDKNNWTQVRGKNYFTIPVHKRKFFIEFTKVFTFEENF